MICWDCGQELDVSAVQQRARDEVLAKVMLTLYRDADVMRGRGQDQAANALESLADELAAAP